MREPFPQTRIKFKAIQLHCVIFCSSKETKACRAKPRWCAFKPATNNINTKSFFQAFLNLLLIANVKRVPADESTGGVCKLVKMLQLSLSSWPHLFSAMEKFAEISPKWNFVKKSFVYDTNRPAKDWWNSGLQVWPRTCLARFRFEWRTSASRGTEPVRITYRIMYELAVCSDGMTLAQPRSFRQNRPASEYII